MTSKMIVICTAARLRKPTIYYCIQM